MKLIRIFSLFYVVFLYHMMQSCDSDSFIEPAAPEQRAYANVDQRLWSYFEEFEEEADKRGLTYNLSRYNLIGDIEDISDEGVAGTCSYGFRSPRHVTIDSPFWANAGSYSKEMVVFHELGHCVLERDHTETLTGNGYCSSIMRSGTGRCRTLYNFQNRDYYLDELFGTLTP